MKNNISSTISFQKLTKLSCHEYKFAKKNNVLKGNLLKLKNFQNCENILNEYKYKAAEV